MDQGSFLDVILPSLENQTGHILIHIYSKGVGVSRFYLLDRFQPTTTLLFFLLLQQKAL